MPQILEGWYVRGLFPSIQSWQTRGCLSRFMFESHYSVGSRSLRVLARVQCLTNWLSDKVNQFSIVQIDTSRDMDLILQHNSCLRRG